MNERKQAFIFKANGERKEVVPANGTDFSLGELKEIVGGYIEIIPSVLDDMIMVIDEEGKLKGKESNPVATFLYVHSFTKDGILCDVVVGDALLCHESMVR